MKFEMKLSTRAVAELLGVGRPTITAVRKMLGIPPAARKMFPRIAFNFLRRYPDFTIKDASDMEAFRQRHPEFVVPKTPVPNPPPLDQKSENEN